MLTPSPFPPPLDPVLNLYDSSGKSIKGSDDANNGRDSLITYTIPKDNNYTLRIRDHLYAGGERFVYRIESPPLLPPSGGNHSDVWQP